MEITGQDAIAREQLEEGLRTRPGVLLSPEDIEADRQRMLRACHDDGFLLASVEAIRQPLPRDRVRVTFRIREGHRARIDEVVFRGHRELSSRELIGASGLRPAKLFGLLERGHYTPGSLPTALENLRQHYLRSGFLDVEVGMGSIRLDETKASLRVEIRVIEGPRYRLAGYRIEEQKLLPDEVLLPEIDLEIGAPYDGARVEEAARALVKAYQRRTDVVPTVRIAPRYRRDAAEVTVVFRIEERDPVFVGSVEIRGNRRTRDRVIRQRLETVPGDVFAPLDLDESGGRLEASGLFRDFEVRTRPGLAPDEVDVVVDVEEKEDRGFFELGGGASSGEGGVAYARISTDNFDLFRPPRSLDDWSDAFTGGGQSLELEIIPGTDLSRFNARFREPYFFSSDRWLTLGGSSREQRLETYRETRLRGYAEIRQFIGATRRLSAALAWRAEAVEISNLASDAPPDVLDAEGHSFLSFPRLSLRWRDIETNRFSGPAGLSAEALCDIADELTGSRVEFVRATVAADAWIPVLDRLREYRHSLHLGAEAGWIDGPEGVPIFERYFLGGPRSFRGFRYRGVGPRQGRTPVGGGLLLRGTVEYSFPLWFRELRAVALFDWGVLESAADRLSADSFRTAAGGGLQIRLPFPLGEQMMPVNLYWAVPITRAAGDETQLFTFTVGYGF